jgi:signal transduction histidine kinase
VNELRPGTAAYIAILLAAALGVTVIAATKGPGPDADDPLVTLVAACCMAAAWLFPIQIASRTRFYVDTAVMIASVLLLPPAFAAVAIGTGTLIAHALRPDARNWAEAFFNTGQAVVVALMAALLLGLAGWRPGDSSFDNPRPLLVLPIVTAAIYLLNVLLVTIVIASEAASPLLPSLRSSLAQDFRVEALSYASLVTTGTLAAIVAATTPWAVILLAVPIVATYVTLQRQTRLRREAEQARLMSDAGLAEAQRLARLGSWEWAPDHDRWTWSDEVYRLFGKEPRSFYPTYADLLAAVDPGDRERVDAVLHEARQRQAPFEIDHRIQLADGAERFVHQRSEVRTTDGEPLVIAGTIQDVTDRVRAEEAMRQATIAAEEASRAKAQLLSMASHDLRTPLTAIQGYLEIVMEGGTGGISREQREMLGVAHRNARQLAALVNDLLDLSRIDAGRLPLRIQPTDVTAAIARVRSTLAPLAAEKGLDLVTGGGSAPIFVSADPDRLDQILLNLVGNAVKFTEEGRVTISASADDSWVTIAVADTGVGIAPEALPHIFEEFRQGGEDSRRKGGAGLGLAIVRHLVGLHGGTVAVQSSPGKGSTFTVRLPAAPIPIEPAAAPARDGELDASANVGAAIAAM